MKITKISTAEAVLWGHPDKIADTISDALLDEVLRQDPQGHAAIETVVSKNSVIVAGEVTAKNSNINVEEIVRSAISTVGYNRADLGFDCYTCNITNHLHRQSPELNNLQASGLVAGDQATITGYASNESPDYLPIAFSVAKNALFLLSSVGLPEVYTDAKAIAVVEEFPKGTAPNLKELRISVHNRLPNFNKYQEQLTKAIVEGLQGIYKDFLQIPPRFKVIFNPGGPFSIGGPAGDTGLTGRKIVADAYGYEVPVGGGAFSGKDPSKVDRSAAYYARYVAKNLVASGICEKALIKVTYMIGQKGPLYVSLDTFGTNKTKQSDEELLKLLLSKKVFNFSVENIVQELDLQNPIYMSAALVGSFGNAPEDTTKIVQVKPGLWEPKKVTLFSWERTDKVNRIQQVADYLF